MAPMTVELTEQEYKSTMTGQMLRSLPNRLWTSGHTLRNDKIVLDYCIHQRIS